MADLWTTPPGPRDGEWIGLQWEDDPDEWAVRGHVSDEQAIAFAREWHEESGRDEPSHYVVRHQWARWSMECTWDGDMQVFRSYWESGPGRFPVTIAHNGDDWDRRTAHRAERSRREGQARAWMLEHYPSATNFEIWPGFGEYPIRICVRVEGLPYKATVELPEGHREREGVSWSVPGGFVEQWRAWLEAERTLAAVGVPRG